METNILEIFFNGAAEDDKTIIKPVPKAIENTFHKNGLINILRSLVPDYKVDDENISVIATLYNYFTGNKAWCSSNEISLNKGIILCGGIGTGKTILMEAFRLYTTEINKTNGFQDYTASEIVDSVNISGVVTLDKFGHNMDAGKAKPITCYIDDIASKLEQVKNYGTNISVMDQLISIRYTIFQRYKKLTHFSTNLYPKDMDSVYDSRVIDRLVEMCNIIELPGKSRRK